MSIPFINYSHFMIIQSTNKINKKKINKINNKI